MSKTTTVLREEHWKDYDFICKQTVTIYRSLANKKWRKYDDDN
jgi:hypothetical protein